MDEDEDMAPIDDLVNGATQEPPTKKPKPNPAGPDWPAYDSCKQYTQEEKQQYYQAKCENRKKCYEQGCYSGGKGKGKGKGNSNSNGQKGKYTDAERAKYWKEKYQEASKGCSCSKKK